MGVGGEVRWRREREVKERGWEGGSSKAGIKEGEEGVGRCVCVCVCGVG